MDILKLNFQIYNFCGLWWPEGSKSSKKIVYNLFTILTLTFIYSFTLMQLLDTILGGYNFDEISNSIFMLFTMMSLCFKLTNFVIRRKSIIALLDTLRRDICRCQNNSEENIQKKFDAIARSNTVFFAILAEMTIVGFVTTPIAIENYKKRILPFKVWLPYGLTNISVYWLMYVQQSVTMLLAAALNVVSDTLVSGLFVQACAQLEILKERISNIANHYINNKSLVALDVSSTISDHWIDEQVESIVKICVQHHIVIYKFSAEVERVFTWVVFFQLFVSILTLCSSVFKLSRNNSAVEIVTSVCYVSCMLLQLLFYCWHGNEVRLKSLGVSDAVFGMEWTILPPKVKKSLVIIMARSRMPVIINCGSMFSLSLETYTMVLKASYSAFNLLQKA